MKGFSAKKLMKSVNVENVVIAVLVIVLVVLVVVYVNKNNEQFQTKGVLYFFYVDWCPHCTSAKPVFNDLEKDPSVTSKAEIKRVNCEGSDEEKQLAKDFNVRGYPTVVYVVGDERKELEAGVSKEAIKALIGA
jgi:thiol-disulfide isomerase/thioredoxin